MPNHNFSFLTLGTFLLLKTVDSVKGKHLTWLGPGHRESPIFVNIFAIAQTFEEFFFKEQPV